MQRIVLIFFICMFISTPVFAVDFAPLEKAPEHSEDVSAEPETPKALLNDENYKIKGRVEYDNDGVLFLEDTDKMQLNIAPVEKVLSKSVLNDEDVLMLIQKEKTSKAIKIDEYAISPSFGSLEYRIGNYTYGTTFGTDLDTAQLEYRTKMFVRYDNNKIGIMTGFGKDEYTSSGRQMESLYLSPEIKLTKSLILKDSLKVNPSYERQRNEVILQYSPKIKDSRDNVKIEAAIGQSYYYKTGEDFYQFSVSTKFKL